MQTHTHTVREFRSFRRNPFSDETRSVEIRRSANGPIKHSCTLKNNIEISFLGGELFLSLFDFCFFPCSFCPLILLDRMVGITQKPNVCGSRSLAARPEIDGNKAAQPLTDQRERERVPAKINLKMKKKGKNIKKEKIASTRPAITRRFFRLFFASFASRSVLRMLICPRHKIIRARSFGCSKLTLQMGGS